jgi:putative Holliday junction resolvase
MRHGTRVGVDVGKVRIGVSRSDPHGTLALPVETVRRASDGTDVARIAAIVDEYDAAEVIVGLPLSLSGARTASTQDAERFAQQLADGLTIPVRMVDERLSTVSAQSAMRASGRTAKNSRTVIDQAAASVILQHALDVEHASARPPGTLVHPTIGTTP